MNIVIDPGHGGEDPGAVYRTLLEKDVVLDIARLVPAQIPQVEIRFTRDTDVYVPLMDRCNIANNLGAALFVSIHCNADPDDDSPGDYEARGEEIWYPAPKKGKAYNLAGLGRFTKSKAAALIMTQYLDQVFPDEPFRGNKETAGLCVLNGTKMPAVLLEIGFIDRSDTARHFANAADREEIARWIGLGIMNIMQADWLNA